MTDPGDDELINRVGALPRPALGAAADARVYARARDAFVTAAAVARDAAAESAVGRWRRLWNRALEPVVVAGVVAGYLAWAATALGALQRGRPTEGAPAIGSEEPSAKTPMTP